MPSEETRTWERRHIITSAQQLNYILGCSRNAISTQSDTWKMTAGHMLTSQRLCNYWCCSLRYQLGNLLCEVISSTRRRSRRRSRLLGACQFVRALCVRRGITVEVKEVPLYVARGKLSSHFITRIQIVEFSCIKGCGQDVNTFTFKHT